MPFVFVGAILAALYLLIKEGVPAAKALATGSIRTRGHRREIVVKAAEPERFRRLLIGRVKLAGIGVGAALAMAAFTLFRLALTA